jgi:16S rRNA (guanine527-N7)-methyltransferase
MKELLEQELKKDNIFLEQSKIQKLEVFANKLLWWNGVHNISGAKTKEQVVQNIIDSIYPITFLKEPKNMLDVGTGAGFPGLILAIVWDKTNIVLSEPINKKAAFLRYIANELNLKNVEVFKNRVEKLQNKKFDLITSRAVSDTNLLLLLTKNVSSDNTEFLFFKGSNVFNEVDKLDKKVTYDIVSRQKRNYLRIKFNGS